MHALGTSTIRMGRSTSNNIAYILLCSLFCFSCARATHRRAFLIFFLTKSEYIKHKVPVAQTTHISICICTYILTYIITNSNREKERKKKCRKTFNLLLSFEKIP